MTVRLCGSSSYAAKRRSTVERRTGKQSFLLTQTSIHETTSRYLNARTKGSSSSESCLEETGFPTDTFVFVQESLVPEGSRFSEGGSDQGGIIDRKEKKKILLGSAGSFVQMSENLVCILIFLWHFASFERV